MHIYSLKFSAYKIHIEEQEFLVVTFMSILNMYEICMLRNSLQYGIEVRFDIFIINFTFCHSILTFVFEKDKRRNICIIKSRITFFSSIFKNFSLRSSLKFINKFCSSSLFIIALVLLYCYSILEIHVGIIGANIKQKI